MSRAIARNPIASMNGLRFFAIMHLVFFHYRAAGRAALHTDGVFAELPSYLQNLVTTAYSSTGLFFLLSGFILTYVYMDDDVRQIRITKARFFLSRFLRIYPLHILLLCLLFVFRFNNSGWTLGQWLTSAFLLQTWLPFTVSSWNVPAWAASCMIVLYLLFPFLAKALSSLSIRGLVATITLATLILWLISGGMFVASTTLSKQLVTKINLNLSYSPLIWFFFFLIGMAGGLIKLKMTPSAFKSFFRYFPADLIAVLLLFILMSNAVVPRFWLRHGFLAPLQILFILALSSERGLVAYVFRNRFIQKLGEVSFSTYLLHAPLITFFYAARPPHSFITLMSYIVTLIGLSLITEKYFTRKVRSWAIKEIGWLKSRVAITSLSTPAQKN